MFSLVVWCVYGLFVGCIVKAVVPGEENFGFLKTVALGVLGSYCGGALLYILGQYPQIEPAGLFMGVVGGVVSLVVYNKLNETR
jgi:uncharacterized membrane protein YeaQ/YmgE (transglycosylase-associated protein family)